MAMLAQIQELPEQKQKQIREMYGSIFPFEVRGLLEVQGWIEKQPWYKVSTDAAVCCTIYQSLMGELNNIRHTTENAMLKAVSDRTFSNIEVNYARDPVSLVRYIYQCLVTESDMVKHYTSTVDIKPTINPYVDNSQIILQSVKELKNEKQGFENLLCQLGHDQEVINTLTQDRSKALHLLSTATAQSSDSVKHIKQKSEHLAAQLQVALSELNSSQIQMMDLFSNSSVRLKELQTNIEIELDNWRRGQQLAGNGVSYTGHGLDEIQEWCELYLDLLFQHRLHLIQLRTLFQGSLLSQIHTETLYRLIEISTNWTHDLVRNSFVIEKQPPQVMKTNTRFTTTARLLVGAKLNLFMTPPLVTVHIISEHQAALISRDNGELYTPQSETAAGEIMNNSSLMEYQVNTRQLCVHFRNMQLKKIKRTEKKGTESVMDEKFALLFNTKISICNDEFAEVQARVFSLPVVVIVHGNQEPHAHATIVWDNAFSAPGRQSFLVPVRVPFRQVGEVLSQKFISCVGRGLTEENLKFLAAKALRVSSVADMNMPITWSQFSKESLPDRNFTFWEWFYAILKVTKEHLRNLWNDGTIYGFVWRKQAEEMLSKCATGTFLMRFSDSEPGGLTVAWKGHSPDGTSDNYPMLQPFTSRDFHIRGLSDRLNDLKYLLYLYPDEPKDKVFSKYYTPIGGNPKTTSGYVKPLLVTCVPGFSTLSLDSYPNTPQSGMQHHSPSESPSNHYDSSNSQMDSTVKHGPHSEESFDDLMHRDLMPNLMTDGSIDPINFSTIDNHPPMNYSYD